MEQADRCRRRAHDNTAFEGAPMTRAISIRDALRKDIWDRFMMTGEDPGIFVERRV